MLKCAWTEWSCWYSLKNKRCCRNLAHMYSSTWPPLRCNPGHGWATENAAERWKDSKGQGGQLAVRTKASACWVRDPSPSSFWPCSPATAEVAGGTYGRCTHLCTPCARNREEFSWNGPTSREGLYLNDTAGKGLRMIPLSQWYKQFSYDSTPAPSPPSYSTPGTVGSKHLTKMRGLARKKTLWYVSHQKLMMATGLGHSSCSLSSLYCPGHGAHWGGKAEDAAVDSWRDCLGNPCAPTKIFSL